MGVAFDVISGLCRLNGAASGTNVTNTFTVGGTANLALCLVNASGPTDTSIAFSTMTLGGSAFSQLSGAKKQSGSDADHNGFIDIYYLLNPPTGSQTLSITMTYTGGGSIGQMLARCQTFSGADVGGTTFGTAKVANSNNASSLTINDTLTANDMFAGLAGNGSSAPTVTTGTQDASDTGSLNTAVDNAGFGHNSGSGTIGLTFGLNSGDHSCVSGVKIIGTTGGAATIPYARRQRGIVYR